MSDTINLDKIPKDWVFLPREKINLDEKWIRHIHCDGARFHVLWWDNKGTHCSEKDCIINKLK